MLWCALSSGALTMADLAVTERIIDPKVAGILTDLKRRLERRFGDRFVALYLFGSRARGDHEPDSDVDVAGARSGDRAAVRFDAGDPRRYLRLLLETGHYIQPWPLEKGSLDDPLAHPHPRICRAVQREGIRVG